MSWTNISGVWKLRVYLENPGAGRPLGDTDMLKIGRISVVWTWAAACWRVS